MARYRKKPVVIDVWIYQGGILSPKMQEQDDIPEWISDKISSGAVCSGMSPDSNYERVLFIKTLEGRMEGAKGDYIIKGIKGELYSCKPDIFEATYEQVEGD